MPLLLLNSNFDTEGSIAPFVLTAGTVAQMTGTAGGPHAHQGTGFARFSVAAGGTSTISATFPLALPPGAVLRLSFAGRFPAGGSTGTTSVTAIVLVNGILPVATISIPAQATTAETNGNYEIYEGYSIPLPFGVLFATVTISFTSTAADEFDIDDINLYLDKLNLSNIP